MKRLAWTLTAAIGLASPAFAFATDAYITADVDLLSGPDQDYPMIDHLEEGSSVDIQGCTDGGEWCDVVAYDERGWVPGEALQAEYGNEWVLVPEYVPQFQIPIVEFSIQDYWDSYYRYRPFYYQRYNWYHWRPPHRQRPYPVDFPPPHPWRRPPPVEHHPVERPPHGVPMPRPVHDGHPYPRPVQDGQPVPPPRGLPYVPPHAIPMPRNPYPPQHGTPVPQPAHAPAPPPPASHRIDTPKLSTKDKDPVEQGQRK